MKTFGWLSLLIVVALRLDQSSAGSKYELIFESIESAFGDDDKILKFDGLRVKKFNRTTFVVNGKFVVKKPITNDITIKIYGLNFQGNQYKLMGDKDFGPFCDLIFEVQYREKFEEFAAHTGLKPAWNVCPYPAGEDELINYYIKDISDILPPYIPGGEKWMVQVRFCENDVEIGGYNLIVLLRNDQSLLKGG